MSSETRSSDTISANISTTENIIQGLGSGSNNGFVNSTDDQDWFRITLRAGEQYQFRALGSSLGDPTLTLRNSSGAQLAYNNDSGAGLNALINFMATVTGTYYLDVGGVGGSTGSYSVLASEGTLGFIGNLNSSIQEPSDHDWYAVNLEAGETYVFQMRGSPSWGGTLANSLLTLRSSTGAIVTQDDNSGIGSDAFIQFTAQTSGTYYLDAGAPGSNTGTYNLTARSFGTDSDGWQAINTNVSLSISGAPNGRASQTGIITATHDHDWYRVTLRAGEEYEFRLNAPNRGEGGIVLDPKLALHNSEGTQIAYNDDYGGTQDSRLLFTARTTGTYYLDVGGVTTSTGAYVVRAREVPADTSTYAKLNVGATRTGDLHAAGDHDWVAVRLTAGQSYNFQQRGSATDDGTLADTFLFLRNASGAIVAQDDNGGAGANSLINFTVRTSGTYYLDASAAGDHTGSYELLFRLGSAATASTTSDDMLF